MHYSQRNRSQGSAGNIIGYGCRCSAVCHYVRGCQGNLQGPGSGSPDAQRLILELKDKLSIDDTLISREIAAGGAQGILTAGSLHIDSEKKKEAVEALVALGYGQAESLKAVNALEDVETMDSGAILKAALKNCFKEPDKLCLEE